MIDPHHLHLIVSHLPVLGVFIGIAMLVWGFVTRSADVKRASLGLFVVCALAAAATVATGDPTEERVEKLSGISKQSIERHEDAGKLAAIVTYVLGAASLAGLVWIWLSRRPGNWVYVAMTVFALVAGVLLARAANVGGLIRHPELGSPPTSLDGADDDDDDD